MGEMTVTGVDTADGLVHENGPAKPVKLYDINTRGLELYHKVKAGGYPNIYGVRVPVPSCWNIAWLELHLGDYSDKEVLQFLRYGWPANRLPSAPEPKTLCTNHGSAVRYPTHLGNYIAKEISWGVVMGPFSEIPFDARVGVLPISTRPKRDSESHRIILALSYLEGESVNDHTPKDTYLGLNIELVYPTVDDLAVHMYQLGEQCLMYKRDVSRCFRWLPLDPFDYSLFGYMWEDLYYFDMVLAMGHRIAPYICQRVMCMLRYIHTTIGLFLLNYVDDFVGAEKADIAWFGI